MAGRFRYTRTVAQIEGWSPVEAASCSLLRHWAARSPPILQPPVLASTSAFKCDPVRQDRHFRAATAAVENRWLDLASIAVEGPWQAPNPAPHSNLPEIRPIREAAYALAEQGRFEEAFLIGTRLRDCDGAAIYQMVGTAIRLRARRAGSASPDYPTEETLRPSSEGRNPSVFNRRSPACRDRAVHRARPRNPRELLRTARCSPHSLWRQGRCSGSCRVC